jgi:hypothetical protein
MASGQRDEQPATTTDAKGLPSQLAPDDASHSGNDNVADTGTHTGSSDMEEESSVGLALPPAIFSATSHPEMTDIPQEAIEGLAQEFVEKVKEGGWDNTSEVYRKNWEKAVDEANETFKSAYGDDAYLQLTSGATD